MGLITSPNYCICKYFLLFKLIAKHTALSTFIQLVESNWCNVSERKNVLVAKLIGDGGRVIGPGVGGWINLIA